MRALGTNKITFKQYLLDTLKKQHIEPNSFKGYNIPVADWCKIKPSGYYDKGYYNTDLYNNTDNTMTERNSNEVIRN